MLTAFTSVISQVDCSWGSFVFTSQFRNLVKVTRVVRTDSIKVGRELDQIQNRLACFDLRRTAPEPPVPGYLWALDPATPKATLQFGTGDRALRS